MASVEVKFSESPKNMFTRFIKRIADRNVPKRLSQYLKILHNVAVEYAPLDTGALRRGHFIEQTGRYSGTVGFKFTTEQKEKNKLRNNPVDRFYGKELHEGHPVGWKPRVAGVGPDWLNKALRDTEGRRKELLSFWGK